MPPDYAKCWLLTHALKAAGVIALDQQVWKGVPQKCDYYAAFGFPDTGVEEIRAKDGSYAGLRLHAECVLYTLEPQPPEEFQLKLDRIFFRPTQLASGSFRSVNGVSGGPIFGFQSINDSTELRLWLVAVQSSQLNLSGMAIGCPTEIFATALETAILSVAKARKLLE